MKYNIKVDGDKFEVEILGEKQKAKARVFEVSVSGKKLEVSVPQEAAPARKVPVMTTSKAPAAAAPTPVKKKTKGKSSSGAPIIAPMAGKIVAINVKPGDKVKEGDTVFVLEAMKMENSIISTLTGVVDSISVEIGSVMQKGDVLCTITGG